MVIESTIPLNAPRIARSDAMDQTRPVQLRASGISKAFGGQIVLRELDLELRLGEVVLLRGENASGKTTLLNILTGNLEPDAGEIHYLADGSPRSYRFPRRWWEELNPFDHFRPEYVAREGIGRTWQEVRLFGSQTLRANILVAEPGHPAENPFVALFPLPGIRAREERLACEADAALARFGLAGREDSSADKISLGQSKRVSIARAVAAGARVLFLDEPLAGLDRRGIDDVLALLKTLAREREITLVIVEHIFNHRYLKDLVTTDWVLRDGLVTVSDPMSATTPAPSVESQNERPEWFAMLAGEGAEIIDEPLPRGAVLTRIRRPDRFRPDATPVLEIRDLVVKRGARTVIGLDEEGREAGFAMTLFQGEIAVLQAPNGWGKTTLVEAMFGIAPKYLGQIIYERIHQLHLAHPWDVARLGNILTMSHANLFPRLTVAETIRLAEGKNGNEAMLSCMASNTFSSLSGGQAQLAKLAISSSQGNLLGFAVHDEPFSMLDFAHVGEAIRLVLKIPAKAILVTTPQVSHKAEET